MNGTVSARVIDMAGIHNFRDYGGYAARGGTLRRGVLWRSGQHTDATPADLAMVHDLGIATVIDLRGDSERAANPCLRHAEFSGDVLFHPGETASVHGRAAHEEMARDVRSADDARNAMLRLYETLPFRPVLVGTFRLYMQALTERDTPSLLHCLAGKDRTGVAAALVHHLMGVHHDDIVEDYLLTNTAGDAEARIAAGARHVRAGFGISMDDAAVRVLMGVDAAFLDRAFATIREKHGSVDAYARDVLGLTSEGLAQMERQLIES
ncbi:tyrosine-protein phosphatase [Novosphingobium sp. SL115]|uniref:tyrosine-protein phosphatase n=1 Tax=Novosphingobium sp. SL115 TaxID=2995150 RepID=UPI0022747B33|nr:tyrosine-protein phosphatase [Novosphingobium sp. SL115]MCY1671429.1 tyrosine-protein phosphatase [Novosphingobium sp. SL115]